MQVELGYATPQGLGTASPGTSGLAARQDHVHENPGGGPAGPYAQQGMTYIVIANEANLTNERALAAGDGISIADNGAGSTVVVSVNLAATSGLQKTGGLAIADSIAGNGLQIASKVLSVKNADTSIAVGAGGINVALAASSGLAISSGLKLNTPDTLTVSTTNSIGTGHTHAITTSANPGAAAAILASTAGGGLTLQSFNIAAAGLLTFGTTNPATLGQLTDNVLGLGSGDAFQSATYNTYQGWSIGADGTLVAQNAYIRGTLHAALFVKDLIEAHAGTMIITKSSGALSADMTVPTSGTWTMTLKDPPGGGFLFANSDVARCKTELSGGIYDIWFTVSARADNGDGTQNYTCTYASGDRASQRVYPAGAPVLDYGVSGDGGLQMTADLAGAPYLSIFKHAGAPYTTTTEVVHLGNMRGAYGIGATDYYGIGLGDYTAGNYLRYETNSGFVLKAGAGAVTIDGNGIGLTTSSSWQQANSVNFVTGATVDTTFYTYIDGAGAKLSYWQSDALASNETRMLINATAPATYRALVQLYAISTTGTAAVIALESDSNAVVTYSCTITAGQTTISGDLAVNGGDMTSTATTFNLLNATVTTLNIGGAATTVALGASTVKVGIGIAAQHTLQAYGPVKFGGNANQTFGDVALGDDQSTSLNVGIYRATSISNAARGGGNTLALAGYGGVLFTVGSAAFGSQTKVAVIDTNGKVGIGTTGPSELLHIQGAGTADASLHFQQIIASTGAYNSTPMAGINFYNKYNAAGAYAGMGGISVVKENTTDGNLASYLALHSRPAGGSVTERMRIASDGTFTGSASNDISDARLKENVITVEGALARIVRLRGVGFNWSEQAHMTDRRQFGVIAQEVEVEFPELVLDTSVFGDGYKSVQYSGFVAPFIEAFKELYETIQQQADRISQLEARLAA